MTSGHDPETPAKMKTILREGEDSGTVVGVAVRYLISPASETVLWWTQET